MAAPEIAAFAEGKTQDKFAAMEIVP